MITCSFTLKRSVGAIVAATTLAMLAQLPQQAFANAAFGANTDINGNPINVPTYFQTSPSGVHPAYDPSIFNFSPTTFTTSAASTTPAATSVTISVLPPIVVSGAAVDATGLIVTVPSTKTLVPGDPVFGAGFPANTKIVAVTGSTTFTTNVASATVSVSGQTLWIIPNPGTLLSAGATINAAGTTVSANSSFVPVVGALVTGGGYPVGTTITSVTPPLLTVDSGAPLRKFVTPLGGIYNGIGTVASNADLANGIPLAITDTNWLNPNNGVQTKDDYYEIAIVEYTEQLHADLAKPTRSRGYVQIETPNIVAKALKDATGVSGSEHIPGVYPNGSPILDSTGKQVYFVHKPHYLGPTIIARSGTPIRIHYTNYLPYTNATGVSVGSSNGTGGELPLPVDETIPGGGAVLDSNGQQVLAKDALGNVIKDAAGNPIPVKMGHNRASIHWHGGDTPWTNDGIPHQWFAPAGDIAYTLGVDAAHIYGMGKGESTSVYSVGDEPDPGPGKYNVYFPNNLTGRLMWYHDHTSGLTRPNVLMGEAAGYIMIDPTELALASAAIGEPLTQTAATAGGQLATGLLDSIGIPLVIEDKTFVPNNVGPAAVASDGKTPASQDARWDLAHWGQPGDLFFPHVYETNQDPNSIDGTNPVGRWDWGPWFWPVFPAQYSLPTGAYGDVTTTPEAFLDTPMVNGQVYPTLTVDPKTYRFRILAAANDRSFNLGLYQAVDANGVVCDANNPTPALPPRSPGDASTTGGATGLGGPAACTEVRMVPAAPTPGFPATWPTDGRGGGVPDPATAGPDMVQIANEAGLLPAVAVWKSQPVVFEQNVRSITIFNVLNHQLLLMGAQRADVLVDFTNYAGQTLILYNDGPAPLPGYDPRIDYFTGNGDQTGAGGAYNTLAGYGPATRSILQIKVNATNTSGTGGPLNLAALQTALPVAYAATQPRPLIPESAYNAAFGTNDVDNYASIGTGSAAKPTFFVNGATSITLTGLTIRSGGLVYPAGTTLTIDPPACTPVVPGSTTCAQATATPIITRGVVTGYSNFIAGAGYTQIPAVTLSATGTDGVNALITVTATGGYGVINKAIQELFDPVFGRMNATLAAELPFSSATVATTIPLAYIDTPNEYLDAIKEGETQIWKVTHNGVDSHPIHFHLVNVQVINRVGWDGAIKPPGPEELGWRETLRMNPLEDVYVIARASKPVTPFGLPNSQRLLDPSVAVGSTLGFTQIDPTTGNAPTTQTYVNGGVNGAWPAATYTNQVTDFDNEYIWHCHILGHEEFDFMRPFVFHPNVLVPDAPGLVTASGSGVTWTDPTPYGGQDAQGIPTAGVNAAYPSPTASPKNEIGFRIYANNVLVGTAVANSTSWTDPAGTAGKTYTVTAWNAAGESLAGTLTTASSGSTTVTAPTAATSAPGTQAATAAIDATGLVVTLSAVPATPLVVGASVSGGGFPLGTTIASLAGTTVFTTSAPAVAVATAVAGTTGPGATAAKLTISLAAAAPLPTPSASAGPAGLTQSINANGTVTLTWTAVPGALSYTVTVAETTSGNIALTPIATVIAGTPATTTTPALAPATTFTTGTLTTTSSFVFSVSATTLSGTTVASSTGALSNTTALPPVAFGASAALSSTGTVVPGSVTLVWANAAANKNNVAGLVLTWSAGAVSHTFAPTTTGATVTGLTTGASYTFTLQAVSTNTSLNSTTVTTTIAAP
jgi:FtsP/CotA-like multicopper oxidase with cupredoxin domain